MTPQEIVRETKHLSIGDKVSIITEISQSLLTDLNLSKVDLQIDRKEKLSVAEREAIVESLYGFAAIEGQTAPTDEEIREDRVNYLLEKYS